ncbi:histidine phosphatase family protein [Schaalia sp. lx-260]|uniref:histidine phosphatase family protein n=1 Tax=Schaalia sp. lx-260 TaxID=2899082 RepID=UPI001E489F3B|nr:histidine phosphatase family protein [Schaalia sp. lx-260]MCD4550205.1 histidine phosphatase family protein [Schaalia sp. lx-260]
MKLVLVRHGRTAANVSGALDTGWPGLPLDATGCKQAEALAQRWEKEVTSKPNLVLVSGLLRTRMTAAPLCERYGMSPRIAWGLREIRAGSCEMGTSDVQNMYYHGTVHQWISKNRELRMPEAETGWEVLGRALPEVYQGISQVYQSVGDKGVLVLVIHGALTRFLTSALSRDDMSALLTNCFMTNTGTTIFEVPHSVASSCADGTFHPHDLLESLPLLTWNDTPAPCVSDICV